jgi:hypothetical protein
MVITWHVVFIWLAFCSMMLISCALKAGPVVPHAPQQQVPHVVSEFAHEHSHGQGIL